MSAPAGFPASGFLNTAAIATRRNGGLAGAPYSLRISSTDVTTLRMSMVLFPSAQLSRPGSRGDRSLSAFLDQRYRIAQDIDASASSHAMFGQMAAEGARAGHRMVGADEMPGDRVQPRAARELALDIGRHRLEDGLHGRKARRPAEDVGIGGQKPPRLLVGRATQHHAVDLSQMRLRLGEVANPAIDDDGNARHRPLQPIDPLIVERR